MSKRMSISGICRLLCAFLLISGNVQAQVERYLEGVHYTRMADTAYLKTLNPFAGKADVLEVFWYGCGLCNAFDPLLNQWVQAHDDSIVFSRSPVIWNATSSQHARVFFAAQQLGIYQQAHTAIFDTIHQGQNSLLKEEGVAALFAKHGADAEKFAEVWHSFAVDTQLRKAEAMQREMEVSSVPALVVDGRWRVNINPSVATTQAMLDVAEFLLDRKKATQGSE